MKECKVWWCGQPRTHGDQYCSSHWDNANDMSTPANKWCEKCPWGTTIVDLRYQETKLCGEHGGIFIIHPSVDGYVVKGEEMAEDKCKVWWCLSLREMGDPTYCPRHRTDSAAGATNNRYCQMCKKTVTESQWEVIDNRYQTVFLCGKHGGAFDRNPADDGHNIVGVPKSKEPEMKTYPFKAPKIESWNLPSVAFTDQFILDMIQAVDSGKVDPLKGTNEISQYIQNDVIIQDKLMGDLTYPLYLKYGVSQRVMLIEPVITAHVTQIRRIAVDIEWKWITGLSAEISQSSASSFVNYYVTENPPQSVKRSLQKTLSAIKGGTATKTSSNPIPNLNTSKCDECSVCGECPECSECECNTCSNCGDKGDIICAVCLHGECCCECWYCSGCSSTLDPDQSPPCPVCDECEGCCECVECTGCWSKYHELDTCSVCEQCTTEDPCCNCVECPSCCNLKLPTDVCESCSSCTDCCECCVDCMSNPCSCEEEEVI